MPSLVSDTGSCSAPACGAVCRGDSKGSDNSKEATSVTSTPPSAWKSADLPGLWALLKDVAHEVYTNVCVTATYIRVHVQHVVSSAASSAAALFFNSTKTFAGPPAPEVFRVHAFMGDPFNGEHRDLTHRLDPRFLKDWEACVARLTGWDTTSSKFRVEMRYTYGTSRKVYRMLLRHGDVFDLPDAQKRCRIPRNILSAQLLGGSVTPGVSCDVLHRASKYAGPFGDFHAFLGLHVRVQELFPFDDQEQNCARFETLRTIDTTARVRDYSYSENPRLVPVMAYCCPPSSTAESSTI